jgi:hypothetical protein
VLAAGAATALGTGVVAAGVTERRLWERRVGSVEAFLSEAREREGMGSALAR